jgi:hypothetical protein
MSEAIKKIGIPTTATITVALMLMSPMLLQTALAAPTVHGPINCSVTSANALQCTFNVSGLGGATTATATLTADATVTTGCINRGAAETQPSGLERTTTTVTQTQTVNVEGGRATFNIVASLPSASELRDCPDGMTPVIVCATYTDVSIEVVPNSGPSRTFPVSGTFSNCPSTSA